VAASDWILVLTALFLGAVALFVPYLAELLKRHIFAPKLEVAFVPRPPDCHLTTARAYDPSGNIKYKEPTYYLRFRVSNKGKSQARRCEVVFEGISTADASNQFRALEQFTPINLIWGSGYEVYVDINPERTFHCDLVDVPSQTMQQVLKDNGTYVDPQQASPFDIGLHLNVTASFYSQPNRLPPGTHRLCLGIYCENAPVVRLTFEITWSGVWKETEQAMFRELVARMVS
jgi:hypothetical protein